MTHEDLRKKAMSILKRSEYSVNRSGRQLGFSCSIVLSELVSVAGDIPDAIGWQYGRSVMIECKVSRSDFFADAKKPQRLAGTGIGERRYFMTPVGLVKPSELPEEWGLIEIDGRSASVVVECPKRTIDLSGHVAEKRLLLSTISRIRTREFLMIQRIEGVDEEEAVA